MCPSAGGEGFQQVADLRVGQGAGDVCLGDHADQAVAVDDRQAPDLVLAGILDFLSQLASGITDSSR